MEGRAIRTDPRKEVTIDYTSARGTNRTYIRAAMTHDEAVRLKELCAQAGRPSGETVLMFASSVAAKAFDRSGLLNAMYPHLAMHNIDEIEAHAIIDTIQTYLGIKHT